MGAVFTAWARLTCQLRLAVYMLSRVLARLQRACFVAWRHATGDHCAVRHDSLLAWQALHRAQRAWYAPIAAPLAAAADTQRAAALCRRGLEALRDASAFAKARRQAQQHGDIVMLRWALRTWRCCALELRQHRVRLLEAAQLRNARVLHQALQAWHEAARHLRTIAGASLTLSTVARGRSMRAACTAWLCSALHVSQTLLAGQTCASRLLRKVSFLPPSPAPTHHAAFGFIAH